MKLKILVIVTAFVAAACQQTTAPTVNQTTKPTATAASIAAPDKSKVKLFDGRGVITKINLELGSVGLDHEEIKGVMAAMENMEFYVSDKKMLDNLKVGDAVNFVLEDNAGAKQIVKIEKK